MNFFKITVAALLLAGLAACSPKPVDPPPADAAYFSVLVDDELRAVRNEPDLSCRRVATHTAGQYLLIEALCDDGSYREYGVQAEGQVLIRMFSWRANDKSARVTEERLMDEHELAAPQLEAWLLIDKRDHP